MDKKYLFTGELEKLNELTIEEIKNLIIDGKLTSQKLVSACLENCEKFKDNNALLEVFEDALEKAKEADEKIKQGFKGKLAGIPIVIKDNILYKGKKATAASKFLKDYVAQYNSTVVDKLLAEGAVIIGRANMDEFAMGGSTEKSAYSVCHNALDFDRVPGGSSGGSASAVASGMCLASLGTDTGGSVRQPSSYNGVVGFKPTYGRVSRYGVIAFASSLDQVGPITRNVEDNAYLLEVLAGQTDKDETSLFAEVREYSKLIKNSIKGVKVGVCKEVTEATRGLQVEQTYNNLLSWLQSQGAELVDITIPDFSLTLPCYYIIAPAEATSNLGRFDGVKYSTRSKEATDVDSIYLKSRSEGFGKEVKRRIMLGNFVLSSGYFDAYYNKAKKLQQKLSQEISKAFEKCDCLLLPTTTGEAFKIGSKNNDPIEMYKEDLFTIMANVVGTPAISIPCGKGENNMPFGMQIMADKLQEQKVYNLASYIEKNYKEGR